MKKHLLNDGSKIIETHYKDEYLNTKETLSFLKIKSPKTLKKYVEEGRLPKPSQPAGRFHYFKKSDLLKFYKNGE